MVTCGGHVPFSHNVILHHQMRHKSVIQKLRYWHDMIEGDIDFKMVKELCFYHN